MAQVLVRDLDDKTVEALKRRARQRRRSLQGELKAVLEEAAAIATFDVDSELARVRALFEGRTFSDSTVLVREDRER